MNDSPDPLLDAVRRVARVQNADLETAEVRDAISRITPVPRRPRVRMVGLVAAAAVAVAVAVAVSGVGGWRAATPTKEPASAGQRKGNDIRPVAARFDAAAARFPLPRGTTYDSLRAQVLATAKQDRQPSAQFTIREGTMPSNDPETVEALVARYSGCKWWEIEANGTFDELSPREQADVRKRNREALAEVLRAIKKPTPIRLSQLSLWDELCKDVK